MSPSDLTPEGREGAPRRRRILVVAMHYPPADDAAAIRARNLVRNLQALGHDVRVITARHPNGGAVPPEARAVRWLDVENLARRAAGRGPNLKQGVASVRPWHRRLRLAAMKLLVPDLYAGWIPTAAFAARREAKEADLVISTGAASAHLAARLARGSRPAVVDINDLWWQNARLERGPFRERINRLVEQGIIRAATALIVPVREQGLEVERRWGRPSTTILTGFDPTDFGAERPNGSGRHPRTIVFAGTLYENFRFDTLFESLARGRSELGWTAAELRLVFIGGGSGTALAEARAHGVDEFVEGVPRLPRSEVLERLVRADALLLPLYPEDPHHIPMRFFESVGSGRPILGIGSAAVPAGRFIEEYQLGVVCESTDDLVAFLNELVTGPRPTDLPEEKREIFEATTGQPALRRLIEETVVAPDPRG